MNLEVIRTATNDDEFLARAVLAAGPAATYDAAVGPVRKRISATR
jgi:hypothetical protein